MNTKIQLTDSTHDVLFKMSEGNPGALRVCIEIIQQGAQIDPDDFMGGLGTLLSLDTLGLYGSQIWMLYKDVCGEHLPTMLAVLRGWQLGIISEQQIKHAVENHGVGLNVPDVCAKVVAQLPRFQLDNQNITV